MIHYFSFVGSAGAIYALLAISLVFVWGHGGIVNLGLAGFFAVGAYTSALFSVRLGLPFITGVLLGGMASAVVGVALTWITRRMQADYLAIVALGFAETLRLVLQNETWLTGGTDGISGIAMPLRSASGAYAAETYAGVVLVALLVCAFVIQRLINSPFGRAVRAARDDGEVAAMAGKNVLSLRLKTFGVGAAVMGVAGGLYAHLTSYIAPDIFSPAITVYIFLAATIGGHARIRGALLGALIITMLLEGTRYAASHIAWLIPAQAAAIREALVGLLLIAILNVRSSGICSPLNDKAPTDLQSEAAALTTIAGQK